ncbi:hypothetical protein QAD02_014949 [Eretmocerus hayati]|uniref:Uncharacterized protein n=1 Tax=Eretmocerus hayati TaxID=131215 RepID=A0ACC2P7A1_9HYME|nr:hypothetical protein QAD02_014949 [Eretmocerus hayati]
MEQYLLVMYIRPSEPLFIPKGEEKITFDIPPEYMSDKYQPIASRILNQFENEAQVSIPVKNIALPDLSIPLALGRHDTFSPHIPAHRKMAEHLINLFIGMRTVEDLISLAAYCRDRVNPMMFIYCLSVAILHRPDTKHLSIPKLTEVFPDKFIDSEALLRAKEEAKIVPAGSRTPIEIPMDWTGTNADPEHKVAYWREDLGVNLHHWYWHLVYPSSGPRKIVAKDRRGELFLYYHHQMMARYNTERLCNGIGRTRAFTNLREPIKEGYFPKLDQAVGGRAWPSRPANMKLADVDRKIFNVRVNISDMERYRDAIFEAIKTRHVRDTEGKIIILDDVNGTDILGNIIESSDLSPNPSLYGDLHNNCHTAIANVHDPDHRHLERTGIMDENATAMRDPVFYVWHAFIDVIYYRYKDTLTPYTTQQLNFPGVSIKDVRISTPTFNPNTLGTHWTRSDVELSRGLDFFPGGTSILARLQHLNYDKFSYTFTIQNSNDRELIGTLRVFIAPRLDEKGQNLPFNEQRKLMIEMDKFTAKLKKGQNVIVRKSTESSLTIPYEVTFQDLNNQNTQSQEQFDKFNYCACGWPQHMLVPRGTTQGYPMDLFVMITDYQIDKVNQKEPQGCVNSISFCGLKDLKYPDTRPMGYPFDRIARQGVKILNEFLTPNMKMQQITVRFNDAVKPRQKDS